MLSQPTNKEKRRTGRQGRPMLLLFFYAAGKSLLMSLFYNRRVEKRIKEADGQESNDRWSDPKKALFMTRIWNPLDQRSVTRINKRVPTSCKELSSWSDGHYFLINISFTFSFLIPPAGGSCLSSSMSLSRRKERKRKEKEMMPAVHLMKGWPCRPLLTFNMTSAAGHLSWWNRRA